MGLNVLVVGSGGREHTIVWKLKQSPLIDKLWCAPGNGGISRLAECVNVSAMDINGMVKLAKDLQVDFVMVAPDDPLAAGMVDALEEAGIKAFGPRKNAAILESSKTFSKNLMKKYHIPTADYAVFEKAEPALAWLGNQKMPIVVKADGLALGKGVLICETLEAAERAVNEMLNENKFGVAGSTIVLEEFLTGPEVTILAFTDSKTMLPMVSSQDHKRAFDGDKGLNTGGMGTFSPSLQYTEEIEKWSMQHIFMPTMDAMNAEGRPFKGVLYFGLMLTTDGPKVIEYNARFGDPETQVVLSRLENDLVDIFQAVMDEKLDRVVLTWKADATVCVVMASGGYPEKYEKNKRITGLDEVDELADIEVFHAGTIKDENGFRTNGGRVLGVTALGKDIARARDAAYKAVNKIHFEHAFWRTDIGIKK